MDQIPKRALTGSRCEGERRCSGNAAPCRRGRQRNLACQSSTTNCYRIHQVIKQLDKCTRDGTEGNEILDRLASSKSMGKRVKHKEKTETNLAVNGKNERGVRLPCPLPSCIPEGSAICRGNMLPAPWAVQTGNTAAFSSSHLVPDPGMGRVREKVLATPNSSSPIRLQ
jgi:hypothetical protein